GTVQGTKGAVAGVHPPRQGPWATHSLDRRARHDAPSPAMAATAARPANGEPPKLLAGGASSRARGSTIAARRPAPMLAEQVPSRHGAARGAGRDGIPGGSPRQAPPQ